MNAQNIDNTPKIKKESKNKIRVEFERAPLKERLKARFGTTTFLWKVLWFIFRLILLIGISYVVLMPFIQMILRSFMAPEDFVDATVWYIPKHFTLDIYKAIIKDLHYFKAFANTFALSFSCAVVQMFICCLIGYGFAKFKFKGNKILFMAVLFSMIVPHQTLQ